MTHRGTSLLLIAALALGSGCTDDKTKMREAQKRRDTEKKAQEAKEAARLRALAPKVDRAKLDAFWDDPSFLKVSLGRQRRQKMIRMTGCSISSLYESLPV